MPANFIRKDGFGISPPRALPGTADRGEAYPAYGRDGCRSMCSQERAGEAQLPDYID
jgi:hypothetical protein